MLREWKKVAYLTSYFVKCRWNFCILYRNNTQDFYYVWNKVISKYSATFLYMTRKWYELQMTSVLVITFRQYYYLLPAVCKIPFWLECSQMQNTSKCKITELFIYLHIYTN